MLKSHNSQGGKRLEQHDFSSHSFVGKWQCLPPSDSKPKTFQYHREATRADIRVLHGGETTDVPV